MELKETDLEGVKPSETVFNATPVAQRVLL